MCTMNTGLNVASDAACAMFCNSEDYLILYVMSYSPIHWKSIIEITLTVGIFGVLCTSPEKISPLVSNVAHWVGGRSRERLNTLAIIWPSGAAERGPSREEVEELGLSVIAPSIYEAR